MPFSKDFWREVGIAAAKLDEQNPSVRLASIYRGFYVSLQSPEIDPTKVESMEFKEFEIEKEGNFFLVIEDFLGRKDRMSNLE